MTTFENKCKILSEVFLYSDPEGFFVEFTAIHDISLALSFAVVDGMVVELTDKGEQLINTAWDNLMSYIGIEDTGHSSLDDILPEGL
jgi:hypothetical protein